MKNKKQLITISIAVIIVIAVTFYAGTRVKASTEDWQTQISVDAAKDIDNAASSKTEDLLSDVDGQIKDRAMDKATPVIDEKTAELLAALQAYFNAKLDGVIDSPEYQAVLADLERIKNALLDNYKYEIDKAFTGK